MIIIIIQCYINKPIDSDLCKTKYPIVLVHGLGFKDLKIFDYWGRIPEHLTKNGCTIYYGNQEAFASIQDNAKILKSEILKILNEKKIDKVNLIAHSKGGLDCRYLISKLEMDSHIASLTTINTPHYGTELIDSLNKLPKFIYNFICKGYDKSFINLGDKHSDSNTAFNQLSKNYLIAFNAKIINSPKVYYQSYTSIMNSPFSDRLLFIPYCLLPKPNDGLVCEYSSMWGNFKGTISSSSRRGISHADIVDFRKKDIKGFDVLSFYQNLVHELKILGF